MTRVTENDLSAIHRERANRLIEVHRYDSAIKELMEALRFDRNPVNPDIHCLIGYCLHRLDNNEHARDHVGIAISSNPEFDYAWYLMGFIMWGLGRPERALENFNKAIEINPTDPNYFLAISNFYAAKREWEDSLEYATRGLRLDPEHIGCLNARSFALLQLGHTAESKRVILSSLSIEPTRQSTFRTLGWVLLKNAEYKPALSAFKDALRQQPNDNSAKSGIVLALKRSYWPGHLLYKFETWVSQFSVTVRRMVGLALFFAMLIPITSMIGVPALLLQTKLVALITVMLLSLRWSIDPVLNLLVRFDKLGHTLQQRYDKRTTWLTIVWLICAVLGSVLMFVDNEPAWVILMIYGFGMLAATGGVFTKARLSNSLEVNSYGLAGIVGFSSMLMSAGIEKKPDFAFYVYACVALFVVVILGLLWAVTGE